MVHSGKKREASRLEPMPQAKTSSQQEHARAAPAQRLLEEAQAESRQETEEEDEEEEEE